MVIEKLKYLTVVILLFFLFGASLDEKKKELKTIEKKITDKKTLKQKLQKEEEDVRNQLKNIESQLKKINIQISNTQKKIKEKEREIKNIEDRIVASQLEISYLKSVLSNEFDKLYRRHYSISTLFNTDVEKELRIYAIVNKSNTLKRSITKKNKFIETKNIYHQIHQELLALKNKLSAEKTTQQNLIQQKEKLLNTVIGKKIKTEEEIIELQRKAKQLTALIDKLLKERKKQKEKYKINVKNLPWPAQGNVILNFGKIKHPELDTYIISNGIKIKTDSDVISVYNGEVLFADDFHSYGKTIIIDHGDFVSIYANLQEILVSPGQKVSENEIIAKPNTLDHILYFELRAGNTPVDPLLYLEEKR